MCTQAKLFQRLSGILIDSCIRIFCHSHQLFPRAEKGINDLVLNVVKLIVMKKDHETILGKTQNIYRSFLMLRYEVCHVSQLSHQPFPQVEKVIIQAFMDVFWGSLFRRAKLPQGSSDHPWKCPEAPLKSPLSYVCLVAKMFKNMAQDFTEERWRWPE